MPKESYRIQEIAGPHVSANLEPLAMDILQKLDPDSPGCMHKVTTTLWWEEVGGRIQSASIYSIFYSEEDTQYSVLQMPIIKNGRYSDYKTHYGERIIPNTAFDCLYAAIQSERMRIAFNC